MSQFTPRERFVIVSLTSMVVVVGAVAGFLLGGVGEAAFMAIVLGIGGFLGAWHTAKQFAKAR